MRCILSLLPAILGLSLIMATAQSGTHHMPTPPEPMAPQQQHNEQPQVHTRRLDVVKVQNEADDLARLAQTIPTDVASVRKGMLPKDVIEKLKQIEKLSKHLRTELNP
ncbi:MAG: hypothetical protein LAP86_31895 [Acidobacteriia bacterium]|nr:hypothetical protein [Terriglobia bacterium]